LAATERHPFSGPLLIREKGESAADERRLTRIEKTHIFRPQSAFIRVHLRLKFFGQLRPA
jgi:hypothetical protein